MGAHSNPVSLYPLFHVRSLSAYTVFPYACLAAVSRANPKPLIAPCIYGSTQRRYPLFILVSRSPLRILTVSPNVYMKEIQPLLRHTAYSKSNLPYSPALWSHV